MSSFRYFRMRITQVKSGPVPSSNLQFTDLNVLNGSTRVNYSLATATSPNTTSPPSELPPKAIDNNITTKWYASTSSPSTDGGALFIIDFGQIISATQYNYTTGNDVSGRDPISWTIDISSDNTNWFTVSTVNSAIITDTRQVNTQNFLLGSICVFGDSEVIMGDMSIKLMKNLLKGDIVLQCKETNMTGTISKVIKSINSNMVKIPLGLLDNDSDLIISATHPIWVNNNKLRVLAKNIKGAVNLNETIEVYNIQFDEEGTFYANNIKIDSVSPYHKKFSLGKNEFLDKSKYIRNKSVLNEDDNTRNKPLMIDFFNSN